MPEGRWESPIDRLPGRLELHAPADPEILDLVHGLLEHLFGQGDVDEQDRQKFEMAVIEVLGNVVEHAFAHDTALTDVEPSEQRRFAICLAMDDDALLASLSDNGTPTILDLSDVTMPDELAESGRGLALATAVLTSLDYQRLDGRNQWQLVLRRA